MVGVTQELMQDAEGVLQDASVDAAEGADFSAAVLVGAWGRLMRHNPILEQP